MDSIDAIPKGDDTVAGATLTRTVGAKTFVELTSAASLILPARVSAVIDALATRIARDCGGEPVRVVPLTRASVLAALSWATTVKAAAAAVTIGPPAAFLIASLVAEPASAANSCLGTKAVELMVVEKIVVTRKVSDTEPSSAVTAVGTTVTFTGMTPPLTEAMALIVADTTCSRTATITAASSPTPEGSFNENVCVTCEETTSLNVIVAPISGDEDKESITDELDEEVGAVTSPR